MKQFLESESFCKLGLAIVTLGLLYTYIQAEKRIDQLERMIKNPATYWSIKG